MSALVVFSPDVRRLAGFYERVLDAQPTTEPSGDVRLRNDLDEVLIHSIPKQMAAQIEMRVPPAPRKNSPMKPIFEVTALAKALQLVESHGGVVTSHTFRLDGITRHDVLDPDGNVIQLRSRFNATD
jgi:predicted enzyme related to lactoylglutathione lyase